MRAILLPRHKSINDFAWTTRQLANHELFGKRGKAACKAFLIRLESRAETSNERRQGSNAQGMDCSGERSGSMLK